MNETIQLLEAAALSIDNALKAASQAPSKDSLSTVEAELHVLITTAQRLPKVLKAAKHNTGVFRLPKADS